MANPEFIKITKEGVSLISDGKVKVEELSRESSEASKQFDILTDGYISTEISSLMLDDERAEVLASEYKNFLKRRLLYSAARRGAFDLKIEDYSLQFFLADNIARRAVRMKFNPSLLSDDPEYFVEEGRKNNVQSEVEQAFQEATDRLQADIKRSTIANSLMKEEKGKLVNLFFMANGELKDKIDI